MAFLAGLAVIFLVMLLRLLRGSWMRNALPVLGLVFVCIFVMMRAVGFHHADQLLGLRSWGCMPTPPWNRRDRR
jgi:peptidoglycan/LPS O-acetylase OafA/YrhL